MDVGGSINRSSGAPARAPAMAVRLPPIDDVFSAVALSLMLVVPLIEVAMRPVLGQGVENASVLVQHMGLVLAMAGAVAAERQGHLTTLGSTLAQVGSAQLQHAVRAFASGSAAILCGMLTLASARFVASEMAAGQPLAYGIPVWVVQAAMPAGFAVLGLKLGLRCVAIGWTRWIVGMALPLLGWWFAWTYDGLALPLWPGLLWLLAILLCGAPIFAVIAGLALALFWHDALPLASISLSHYAITVNPSLPALPLFTLAGLIFARTGAARRLSELFLALFGGAVAGTVMAAAVLCSAFTAFTGGSGVTILALGGLLLPLLLRSGYPEQRGIGLVTSASALGVLLAPSVPLIMYAVIARVPILDMFLAGLVPAVVMVASLLLIGGFLRGGKGAHPVAAGSALRPDARRALLAAWRAKWELLAPVVALGTLMGGLATPTECAALTAAYAIATQAIAHRDLGVRLLWRCLVDCGQLIGAILLILGMALALTNYLVDAGVPDAAIEAVRDVVPSQWVFLLVLCLFLAVAAAMMEIYAAIVVLVPLLLPVALSYGIDPVHFGVIFLAAMELGFLCPPAGLNIYFASAMFDKSIRYVATSVLPAVAAIFVGTVVIALVPALSTGLPRLLLQR